MIKPLVIPGFFQRRLLINISCFLTSTVRYRLSLYKLKDDCNEHKQNYSTYEGYCQKYVYHSRALSSFLSFMLRLRWWY